MTQDGVTGQAVILGGSSRMTVAHADIAWFESILLQCLSDSRLNTVPTF